MLDNKQIPPLWSTWSIPPQNPNMWNYQMGQPIPQNSMSPPQQPIAPQPPTWSQNATLNGTHSIPSPQTKTSLDSHWDGNILQELTWWTIDFWKEKNSPPKKKKKLEYIQTIISSLFFIQLILLIGIIVASGYIYIQKQDTYVNIDFLSPICLLLLWSDLSEKNTNIGNHSCSSLAGLKTSYIDNTGTLKKELIDEINNFFTEDYKIENFWASSEIYFLTNNKINRLRVLNILNEFDRLKNEFTGKNKSTVQCIDIRITDESIVHLKCQFIGSVWISGIIGNKADINNNKTSGTTISYAMSFLNFIEQHPQSHFQVLEYPSTLTIEDTEARFKETSIEFKLKYSQINNTID